MTTAIEQMARADNAGRSDARTRQGGSEGRPPLVEHCTRTARPSQTLRSQTTRQRVALLHVCCTENQPRHRKPRLTCHYASSRDWTRTSDQRIMSPAVIRRGFAPQATDHAPALQGHPCWICWISFSRRSKSRVKLQSDVGFLLDFALR